MGLGPQCQEAEHSPGAATKPAGAGWGLGVVSSSSRGVCPSSPFLPGSQENKAFPLSLHSEKGILSRTPGPCGGCVTGQGLRGDRALNGGSRRGVETLRSGILNPASPHCCPARPEGTVGWHSPEQPLGGRKSPTTHPVPPVPTTCPPPLTYSPATFPPSSPQPTPHCSLGDSLEVFSSFLLLSRRPKLSGLLFQMPLIMIIISACGYLLSAEEVPGISHALSHLLTQELSKNTLSLCKTD